MKTLIYKNYTQTALDAEYDNRAKVADAQKYLIEWSAFCQTTKSEYPTIKTHCFDVDTGLQLDIIYPKERTDSTVPVQVFFHGGYWKAFSKEQFTFVARAFADYGIATVIVDYQLIPATHMNELVRQCRQSVAWLYENAARLDLDVDNIHISGHSAGGHLAAMCLATDWNAFSPSLPPQIIASAVGISGLYDLTPIQLCFLQADLTLTDDDVAQNSPVRLDVPAAGKMITMLGQAEGAEYLAQSNDLHKVWPHCCGAPEVLLPYNHFTIMGALADPTSIPSRLIRKAMAR